MSVRRWSWRRSVYEVSVAEIMNELAGSVPPGSAYGRCEVDSSEEVAEAHTIARS